MKEIIVNAIYWIAAIANTAIGYKVTVDIYDKVWDKIYKKTNNLLITLIASCAAGIVSGLVVCYAIIAILGKIIKIVNK